jgi:hypothetical protein
MTKEVENGIIKPIICPGGNYRRTKNGRTKEKL